MNKRILIISGRKQSGKDTLGNFVIANHRELFGPESVVRKMGFADPLKAMVHELFGVPLEWLHGTDEGKNRLTDVHWRDFPCWDKHPEPRPASYMTVRELLQQFGTNVVRRMNPNAWVNALKHQVDQTGANLIVIIDARFPNEILGPKGWGYEVKSVRLRRNEDVPAEHESEGALDQEHFDWSHFDAVIDNREMGKIEQVNELARHLCDWGWRHDSLRGIE